MVGGAPPSADGVGRTVVTIVGSRGNFCSGALIAPDLVLSAAHCVQPGADYKIVDYDAHRQPQLRDVRRVAVHPQFNMQAIAAHRATADVALLQLAAPLRGKPARRLGAPRIRSSPASRFTIAGIGVAIRGDGKSGGIVRAAGLVATGKPGTLQIRLVDPATRQHARRPRRLHRRFRRARSAAAGRPRDHRRRGVSWSTGAEQRRRLRRHDRRHAADAVSRLDRADRAAMGFCVVSLMQLNGASPPCLFDDWRLENFRQRLIGSNKD